VKVNNKPPCLKDKEMKSMESVWYVHAVWVSTLSIGRLKCWTYGGCQLFEDLICQIYLIFAFT
jgi:hypothetical protein